MAYFNHAFTKVFLGTGTTLNPGFPSTTNPASDNGYITTNGTPTSTLATLGPGYFGLFNKDTYTKVNFSSLPGPCCPLVLASSSLYQKDKISPYIGGYQETNKSKYINPKYINQFYYVDACTPQNAVVSVGNTPGTIAAGVATATLSNNGATYTTGTGVALSGGTGYGATINILSVDGGGNILTWEIDNPGYGYTVGDVLTIAGGDGNGTITVSTLTTTNSDNFQGGTTAATCCFEFLCGETYYLRLDLKGSPLLRFLNHNSYHTLSAYTGCCSGPTPTVVDSTLVMIEWAKEIVLSEYTKSFVLPVVFDEAGVAWYAPGTTVDPLTGAAVTSTQWWDAYVSTGHTANACAGLRLFGAYVETKFGNCSFQITDFFEKELVRIYASMVDYNGDPCVFSGICVYTECYGLQGMGFGEQVLRDLILSESYLQNYFHTDIRIREITQGSDMLADVNRNALYGRYFILHSVPRYNNPSGTFDNDQYMLEVIVNAQNATFEANMSTWLTSCGNGCTALSVESCTPCVVPPNPEPVR
jgi:hypothetical protein